MNVNHNKSDKNIILSGNKKVLRYSSELLGRGLDLAKELEKPKVKKQAEDWFEEGRSLFFLGKDEEALVCFIKATQLEPKNADYWCWQVSILDKLGKYGEALVCLKKATELDPDNGDYWYWLGKVFITLI